MIRLFESRDERAIAETAEKYGSYCRKIGMNILHSSEDCEECLDVFACFLLCLCLSCREYGNGTTGTHNGNL